MEYTRPLRNPIARTPIIFVLLICFVSSCAELDQLLKPRVDGLQQASNFDNIALIEGGIGEAHFQSSLNGKDIHINALETMFIAALREKRPDVMVSQHGRYSISAILIADDVTHRTDNLDSHIYKWSKRRVKVSYVVMDGATREQVWSGIIETESEELATYEKDKDQKKSDKVLDTLIAAINKEEVHPFPTPPLSNDVVKWNFEGFALNLPGKK